MAIDFPSQPLPIGTTYTEPATGVIYTWTGTAWDANAAGTGGTVTRIDTTDGVEGGPIVTSGTLSVDNTVVRTTGTQYIDGQKGFLDSVLIGSNLPNTSAITLGNDGTAIFTNRAQNTQLTTAGDPDQTLVTKSYVDAGLSGGDHWTLSGNNLYPDSDSYEVRIAGSGGNPTITLSPSGSITAAGNIVATSSGNPIGITTSDVGFTAYNTGGIYSARGSGTDPVFYGLLNDGNGYTSRIDADGDATFTGEINTGDRQTSSGGVQIREVGSISSRRDGSGAGVYTVYNGGNTEDDVVISMTNDGNITAAGDVTAVSYNTGPLAGFRNQLINGNYQVWQRGTTMTTTNNAALPTADKWKCNTSSAGVTLTQKTDNNPPGFAYSIETDGGTGGTNGNQMINSIELPSLGNAGPFVLNSIWTLSWYINAQSPPTMPQAIFFDEVTPGSAKVPLTVSDMKPVPGYESITVGAQTWTRYQVTVTVDDAPVSTSARLRIGVTFGDINVGSIAGRRMTGVQLEYGTVATPYEVIPIQTQLANCQRYFYQYTSTANGSRVAVVESTSPDNGRFFNNQVCPVTLRVDNPDVNIDGTVQIMSGNTGLAITDISSSNGCTSLACAGIAGAAGTFRGMRIQQGGSISFDADF